MKRVLAAIFARGGSKGLPGKNVRPLGGVPLVARAVRTALASSHVSDVIVSTDDERIASCAREAGADVPFMRPAELAQDDSPEWMAWRHAVSAMEELEGARREFFLSVPTTSPLRSVVDVDACLERILRGDCDLVLTVKTAHRNPYFNMVTLDGRGFAQLAARPDKQIERRQDAPPIWDVTTVAYAARTDYIMNETSLFAGRTAIVEVPEERAIDIDTELDFAYAEFLLARRGGDA